MRPSSLRVRPAHTLPPSRLVTLFNDAYSDYSVPMHLSETLLTRMVDLFSLDLAVSRVGWAGRTLAALTLVGRRDDRAWLAGVGVAVAMRHRGYGDAITRAACDAARDDGARDIWLEVLDTNFSARRIYEAIGFETTHRLGVWTCAPTHGAPPARPDGFAEVAPTDALGWLAPRRTPGASWQRSTETFARGLPYYRALAAGDPRDPRAVVLYSAAPEFVDVMEVVARDDAWDDALELLRALRTRHPDCVVRMVNYPETSLAVPLFEALGAIVIWWQQEMVLRG